MDYKNLRNKLTRRLAKNPDLVDDLFPVIKHASEKMDRSKFAQIKTSTTRSTALLTEWAMLRNERMPEREVIRFFRSEYGWSVEWNEDRSELRWELGDRVKIDLNNCENTTILGSIDPEGDGRYDGAKGVISETEEGDRRLKNSGGDPGDVVIDLQGGDTLYVEEGQQKQKSGLLTPEAGGKFKEGDPDMLEVVYISQPSYSPDERAISETEEYIQKDKNRRYNYYAGHPKRPTEHKEDGDVYFGLALRDARSFRTLTPAKGRVLYMGKTQKRPFREAELEDKINRLLVQKGEEPKYD